MKFSPTTVIGYARLVAALAICGKPVWDFYTITNYNSVAEVAGATGLLALVNGAISVVAGHFTADSAPVSKTNDAPVNPPTV